MEMRRIFHSRNRLRKESEFDRVFAQGRTVHTPRLIIRVLENGLNRNRLGLVVKKTSTAISRNRTKRLIREAFRQLACVGFDVVVIPRRGKVPEAPLGGATLTLEDVARDLLDAVKVKVPEAPQGGSDK